MEEGDRLLGEGILAGLLGGARRADGVGVPCMHVQGCEGRSVQQICGDVQWSIRLEGCTGVTAGMRSKAKPQMPGQGP